MVGNHIIAYALQAPIQAPSLRGLAGRQARLREFIRDAEL